MERKRPFLRGISYELGELRDIGDIPELQEDEGLLEVFRIRGLERYSVAPWTPAEWARRSIASTLAKAAVDAKDIDVVVYATDHLTQERLYSRPELNQLLVDAGLENAFPYGVSLSGCTNFSAGLELATSFIQLGSARRVLLLIVEKLLPGGTRLLDLGMSVVSDAVVSCVISDEPGDYEVLSIGRCSKPGMERLSLENNLSEFFAATGAGMRTAADRALEPLEMGRSDLARLFTNNYASHVQQTFIKHIGFSKDRCFFDNVPRFAHAFSADTLINLVDCEAAGKLKAGDRCMLLGTSPTSWGAVVVERTAPGAHP